jgi:hypothetical protein
MQNKQEYTLASHKLSLVSGVYVIAQKGLPVAVCDTLKLVLEWLDGASYDGAQHVTISLCSLVDFEADNITHLIADDLMGDYKTYEDYAEFEGYALPWLEHWFEAMSSEHVRDIRSRRERERQINAPLQREVVTLIDVAPYSVAAE